MKKVTIKNLQGQITHGAEFQTLEQANAWIDAQKALNSWGKPERLVMENTQELMSEDISLATEITDIVTELGTMKQYKFPATFTVEIEDITGQIAQEKERQEALALLAATDWYIIREMDSGTLTPEEIKLARADARLKI
jgi:hypothetical protein